MRELKSRSTVRLCVLVTALCSASPALAQHGWRGSGPPHQEQRQQNGGGWGGGPAPPPGPPPPRGPRRGGARVAPPAPPAALARRRRLAWLRARAAHVRAWPARATRSAQ